MRAKMKAYQCCCGGYYAARERSDGTHKGLPFCSREWCGHETPEKALRDARQHGAPEEDRSDTPL
jgi:hypothetical protein